MHFRPDCRWRLVAYFKFLATKEINQIRGAGHAKVFQRGYYEHIIRNEREWNAIAAYIRDNPLRWTADLDNPDNFLKSAPPKTTDEYWRDAGTGGMTPPLPPRPL